MNAPSNTPPSKGMMMIAAFRAQRLNQRPMMRTTPDKSHVTGRVARSSSLKQTGSVETAPLDTAVTAAMAATGLGSADSPSIFADPICVTVAEQQSDAAALKGADPIEEETAPTSVADIASEDDRHGAAMAEAQTVTPQTIPVADGSDTPPPPASMLAEQCSPAKGDESLTYDPPLAEIGFGPGMLIRLGQLGLHTTGDLAKADAGQLRAALGDISRLVDVEAWIASAQQTAHMASSG